MQFVDTHTHIYLPEFDDDREEVIKKAVGNGICMLLMPNIDIESVGPMLAVADLYPGVCYPMIGLHPTSVGDDYLDQLKAIERISGQRRFIAVGEIGIDLYHDKSRLKEQMSAFRRQVAFAISSGLPVAVHARDSFPEVFSVLEEFSGTGLKGVFHAFSGNAGDARRAVKMGFMLGIGGIVTFKNSGLDSVLLETGPDNIILETDSPYLAPSPYRGKRNESSYICIINRRLAGLFGRSEEEMASLAMGNTRRLFNLL
ncbi:MAG: TatD family hydrolase [Bacteroidales bacterium]|jgi:TatD DNase family protein|nr:TatD family hydrolase [Bacteroidales bacterium]